MHQKKLIIILLLLFITLSGVYSGIINEVFEIFYKKFAREIAEEGGEQILRNSIKKLIKNYGQDSVINIVKKFGPKAVPVIRRFGNDAIVYIRLYGTHALTVLSSHQADDVIRYAAKYGDTVVKMFYQHPGLGKKIIKELGEDGIAIANKLRTQDLIQLLKVAPKLKERGVLKTVMCEVASKSQDVVKLAFKYPIGSAVVIGGAYITLTNKSIGKAVGGELGGFVKATFLSTGILPLIGIFIIILIIYLLKRKDNSHE